MNDAFSSFTPRVVPLNYDAFASPQWTPAERASVISNLSEPGKLGIGFLNQLVSDGTQTDPDGSITGTPGALIPAGTVYFLAPNYAGEYTNGDVFLPSNDVMLDDASFGIVFKGGEYFDALLKFTPPADKCSFGVSVSAGSYIKGSFNSTAEIVSATIQETAVNGWDDTWQILLDGKEITANPPQQLDTHWPDKSIPNNEVFPGFVITPGMGLKSGSVILVSAVNTGGPWTYSPWTVTLKYSDGSSIVSTIGSSASGTGVGDSFPTYRFNGQFTVP